MSRPDASPEREFKPYVDPTPAISGAAGTVVYAQNDGKGGQIQSEHHRIFDDAYAMASHVHIRLHGYPREVVWDETHSSLFYFIGLMEHYALLLKNRPIQMGKN